MQQISSVTSQKFVNLSFFCALLVVAIHVRYPREVASAAWWVYAATSFRTVAVPFFFLISGYLLAGHIGEPDWWKRENKKRISSLLIPYASWSVLWLAFLVVRRIIENLLAGKAVCGGVFGLFGDHTLFGLDLFNHPQMDNLWYLRSLMLFVLFSPILNWLLERHLKITLLLAFVKLLLYRGDSFGTWFYFFDRLLSLGFIFYFLLGMALRKSLITVPRRHYTTLAGGMALVLWCVTTEMRAGGDPCLMPLSIKFIAGRLEAITTLLWMYFFWMIIPSRPIPRLLAKTSFGIYLVHWFVLAGLWNHIMGHVMGSGPIGVVELLLSLSVGIVGSLIVVIGMQFSMPRIASFLFGGRS